MTRCRPLLAALLLVACGPVPGGGGDEPPADAGTELDAGDCVPEAPAATCERHARNCGPNLLENNCGVQVLVECGACGGRCGHESPGVCWCFPTTIEQRCGQKNCGTWEHHDGCGLPITDDCGTCSAGTTCAWRTGRCE